MSTNLNPYTHPTFGNLRTITLGERILFCAKDAAIALGYKDPVNAIKQHCKGVAIHHPLVKHQVACKTSASSARATSTD